MNEKKIIKSNLSQTFSFFDKIRIENFKLGEKNEKSKSNINKKEINKSQFI